MSDANLQAVFFDFDGVICQTEVCRLDALEVRLHALGLHPDRRGLYRMVSGGLGSREAAMDALLGSQPLYWQHREEVLARHPIRFCYLQLLTPGLPEVLHTLHSAGLCAGSCFQFQRGSGGRGAAAMRHPAIFPADLFRLADPAVQAGPLPLPSGHAGLRPVAGNLPCGGGFSRWHLCRTGRRPASGGPAGP